jgi:succinate dehydrogenase hydrophobic anchor subunit
MPPLTPRQRLVRLGIIAVSALLLSLSLLKSLNPSLPALPCGFKALTGLPCLFCGGTRSACAALRGDFASSLYLNALSIPLLAFILLLAFASALEIARGRPFANWQSLSKPFLKLWPALILLLLVLWAVHLIAALRTPKPELLNPDKTIAARLRAWLNQ